MEKYLVILLAVVSSAQSALPNGWKACSKSSSDYNKCIAEAINYAISTLENGSKRFGLMPLDPLKITSLEVPRGKGPVSFELSFNNLEVLGLKGQNVKEIDHSWKRTTGSSLVPTLTLQGDYKIDGQIMVLPLKGEGRCNFTLGDLTVDWIADWKREEKNGVEHILADKVQMKFKPKSFYIHLDNLFNGDKVLGESTNKALNDSWEETLKELGPTMSIALSKVFQQLGNQVLSKIRAQDIDID